MCEGRNVKGLTVVSTALVLFSALVPGAPGRSEARAAVAGGGDGDVIGRLVPTRPVVGKENRADYMLVQEDREDFTDDPLGDWLEQNVFVAPGEGTLNPSEFHFVEIHEEDIVIDPSDRGLALQISNNLSKLKFEKSCHGFADQKGLGPWGDAVFNEILASRNATLLAGTPDLKKACPRYDRLNSRERAHVYVMLFAAMAFYESTCNPDSGVRMKKGRSAPRGPNGQLAGMIQLHKGKEGRYASECKNGDSNRPETTLTCGIAMLNEQVARDGRVFSPASYWDVLRNRVKVIRTRRGRLKVNLGERLANAVTQLQLCHR